VAFPAWLARFNKLVTNPILRPVAARAPYFGVVVHRGRVSGRVYRTPVNVFQRGEEFIFALTYGPDRDWVRNLMNQGRFMLIHRGRRTELIEPRLWEADEVPAEIPAAARAILRRASVHTFLLARRAHGRTGRDERPGPPRVRTARAAGHPNTRRNGPPGGRRQTRSDPK
jgi:deazaflavin-dependent oxidoreductase (nitroreductase family)